MVSPCNTDIGNSETVAIAWEFDPRHERTLCVMTKADLAEKGFADQFNNNLLNLKLGAFIVRNRTQEEVDDRVTFAEAWKREVEVITNHKELK